MRNYLAMALNLPLLHLMESPKLDKHSRVCTAERSEKWRKSNIWIGLCGSTRSVRQDFTEYLNQYGTFTSLDIEYAKNGFKDRKGRKLSGEDVGHYHGIVVATHETALPNERNR